MQRLSVFLVFIIISTHSFSQDDGDKGHAPMKNKKFHAGLYFGSLFASGTTTSLYDGYGFNTNGEKNNFFFSFLNRSINYEYGGGNSQPDQIAVALGVNHGDWSFNESDMPLNLSYNVAIVGGIETRFYINNNNSIMLNVKGCKLSCTGNFTIEIVNTSPVPQQPGYISLGTFPITGTEQRFMFELGYQHVFGEEGGFNFLVEGGAVYTQTKYLKNQIAINYLVIDLSHYYSNELYEDFNRKHLKGGGFGAWAGVGFTITASTKATVQLVYNSSLENIALGNNPGSSLQHYVGIRAYYKL